MEILGNVALVLFFSAALALFWLLVVICGLAMWGLFKGIREDF